MIVYSKQLTTQIRQRIWIPGSSTKVGAGSWGWCGLRVVAEVLADVSEM